MAHDLNWHKIHAAQSNTVSTNTPPVSLVRFSGTTSVHVRRDHRSELVNKTMDLRKMMYVDYVSGDVKVLVPSPGSQFDSKEMQPILTKRA
ncbi:hypothetical protein F5887DRAFT_1294155, partial [Amanita rubescens]